MRDPIIDLIKKRKSPCYKSGYQGEYTRLINTIRDIEKEFTQYPKTASEEIFRRYTLLVQARHIGKNNEITVTGGRLSTGMLEYKKTTFSGFDHFIAYTFGDIRMGQGLERLERLCRSYDLSFKKRSGHALKIMDRKALVAQIFPKGKKCQDLYDIISVHKSLRNEARFLFNITTDVYAYVPKHGDAMTIIPDVKINESMIGMDDPKHLESLLGGVLSR